MKSILCAFFFMIASTLLAQIVNIEEMRIQGTNDSLRWYGALKSSLNMSKVQEKTVQMTSDVRVQYKHQRHVLLGLLNTNLLRAGNRDFIRSGFVHLRYNYKLTRSLSWEAYGQSQNNRLLLMKERSLLGTGVRQRIYLNYRQNSRLYLGLAYLYERNVFTEGNGQRNWNRLSHYMSVTLRHKKTGSLLQSTTYWQPVIGLIKNHRFSTEWALELPISKHLRFSTDYVFSLDRGLPTAAPLRVFTWTNGLVWRL
jgi:hypothetical protein